MQITITLTDAEVKGLKEYLKEVSSEINPTITKADIKQEIAGMVNSCLQASAVYDYIQKYL